MTFSVSLIKKMISVYETRFKIRDEDLKNIQHRSTWSFLFGFFSVVGLYYSISGMLQADKFFDRMNLPVDQAQISTNEFMYMVVFSLSLVFTIISLALYSPSNNYEKSFYQKFKNKMRKVILKRKLKNLSQDVLVYHKEIRHFFESQNKTNELRSILDVLSGKSMVKADLSNIDLSVGKLNEKNMFPSYNDFVQYEISSESKSVEFFEKNSSNS